MTPKEKELETRKRLGPRIAKRRVTDLVRYDYNGATVRRRSHPIAPPTRDLLR